jgi:Fe-S cluster biogenesis protein NfuA
MTEDYRSRARDGSSILATTGPDGRGGGVMPHPLDSALDQFRPGFDADGFDITVDSVQGDGTAVVRIRHRPGACEECLIPDDMLTGMLTTALRRAAPDVTGVVIEHETAQV